MWKCKHNLRRYWDPTLTFSISIWIYSHWCPGRTLKKRSDSWWLFPTSCFPPSIVLILSPKCHSGHTHGLSPSLKNTTKRSACVLSAFFILGLISCFQISMETLKMSVCYFMVFVFALDWIRAKADWISQHWASAHTVYGLCDGRHMTERSSWFSDQSQAWGRPHKHLPHVELSSHFFG